MSDSGTGNMAFEDGRDGDDIMYVDVDGYEGPLDLLLDMARRQKVDLAAISVLALAEQYLAFIETIRRRRIEVAADYLVMAAWLAYLKSRLMVPQAPTDEEPSGESLAAVLQFRLKRLEAMRDAVEALKARPRLGISVFPRGMPEPLDIVRRSAWDVNLYDLLKAYAVQRERSFPNDYSPYHRTVLSLQDARDRLQALIGDSAEWGGARCLSGRLSRRAGGACNRSGLELFRLAGTGPPGRGRTAPDRRFRADFRAPPRR